MSRGQDGQRLATAELLWADGSGDASEALGGGPVPIAEPLRTAQTELVPGTVAAAADGDIQRGVGATVADQGGDCLRGPDVQHQATTTRPPTGELPTDDPLAHLP